MRRDVGTHQYIRTTQLRNYVTMKPDIHPAYHENAVIKCACGATYRIGSTKEKLEVEICSACHPFYTGAAKIVDTAGRVEKFRQRLAKKRT